MARSLGRGVGIPRGTLRTSLQRYSFVTWTIRGRCILSSWSRKLSSVSDSPSEIPNGNSRDSNLKSRPLAPCETPSRFGSTESRKETSVHATGWCTGGRRGTPRPGGFVCNQRQRPKIHWQPETARPLSSSSVPPWRRLSRILIPLPQRQELAHSDTRAAGERNATTATINLGSASLALCKSASAALPRPCLNQWWWIGTGQYAGRRRTAVDSWPSWVRGPPAQCSRVPADGRLPRA